MKKLIIMLLLIASGSSYAQITLENQYPNNSLYTQGYLRTIKLSASGDKYVIYDTSAITLYNLNHTVFRTINIPPNGYAQLAYYIWYISEELFNTNPSDIEYMIYYGGKCKVYDESGILLFSEDSVFLQNTSLNSLGPEELISHTSAGHKMIIYTQGWSGHQTVYSLPGFYPCNDCTNGVPTGIGTNNSDLKEGTISNYPNPAKTQTTIEYELPQGVTKGELVFYTLTGQELKRMKVTNAFRDIIISTAELDAGTYYYQLQTASGFKAGKKMVVVK